MSQVTKSDKGKEPARHRRYKSIEQDGGQVAKQVRRAWHAKCPYETDGKDCHPHGVALRSNLWSEALFRGEG